MAGGGRGGGAAADASPTRRRGRPSSTPEAVEQRRQELVEAAFEVFAERGYHGAGIADIAARLDIGHGTFYRYFENKRDILDHVFDYAAGRILDQIITVDDREAESLEELRDQLTALGERVFTVLIDEDPRLPRMVLLEVSAVDAELMQRLLGLLETVTALLGPVIGNGVRRGLLRSDLDVESVARALTGCVLSGLFTMVRTPMSAEGRRRYVNTVVALVCDCAPRTDPGDAANQAPAAAATNSASP